VGPGAFRRIALRKGHDEEEGERKRRLLVARAKADKGGETSRNAARSEGDDRREGERGKCGVCVCVCVCVRVCE
jgi:hypothetical protein